MKAILTIILVITLFSARAQQTPKETYLTQPDLKRFTGEWLYVSHDTTFLIDLKLVKTDLKDEREGALYLDVIQGDYTLKKAGQILQSSVGCSTIKSGGYVDGKINKDKIRFLFYDLTRKTKSGSVVFELLNNKANEASWTLTNTEGIVIGKFDFTFSVPRKGVFKKIK